MSRTEQPWPSCDFNLTPPPPCIVSHGSVIALYVDKWARKECTEPTGKRFLNDVMCHYCYRLVHTVLRKAMAAGS